jgi:hypothetical protein
MHALSRQARGVVQQLIETRALKGRHPEFGEQVLLVNPPLELWRQSRRFSSSRPAFNYRHPVSIVLCLVELNVDLVPTWDFEMGLAS